MERYLKVCNVLAFVVMMTVASAQDTLVMKSGPVIKAKVLEIALDQIKYKKWDNLDGPTYSSSKADVLKIKYVNGSVDVIEYSVQPVNSSETSLDANAIDIAKEYIGSKVVANSNRVLSLTSFNKTNGIHRDLMGQKFYEIEYEVTAEFVTNGFVPGNDLIGYFGNFSVVTQAPSSMYGARTDNFGNQYKSYPKGARILFTGSISLVMTDNGYRAQSFKTKTYQELESRLSFPDASKKEPKTEPVERVTAYYEGGFRDGKRNGKGKQVFSDSSYYEGEWKDDKRNGEGFFKSPSGVSYKGIWKDDINSASYRLVYASNVIYEGQMNNDKREGIGEYIFADGAIYRGEWKNNVREGQGTQVWKNGLKYTGQWKADAMNGNGVLQDSLFDGGIKQTISGIFKDGKIYNGTIYSEFKHGKDVQMEVHNGVNGEAIKVKK